MRKRKNRIETVITDSMEPTVLQESRRANLRVTSRDPRVAQLAQKFTELPQQEKKLALAGVGLLALGIIGLVGAAFVADTLDGLEYRRNGQ